MRLPAVAIAAAFACGIALGLRPAVERNASRPALLVSCFAAVAVFLLAGILLLRFERLFTAATLSLLSWAALGFLGACIAEQPRPADHVIALVEEGRIRLDAPLRWHGVLRDE